jgi:hypothetical protein
VLYLLPNTIETLTNPIQYSDIRAEKHDALKESLARNRHAEVLLVRLQMLKPA